MNRPVPTAKDAKAYALGEIARLIRTYDICPDEIGGHRIEESSTLLTRILTYIGGTMVVAGLCIYLGLQWELLDSFLRVLLTFGPGVIALTSAIIVTSSNHKSGLHIAAPLYLLAAIFQSGGMFIFLDEFTTGQNPVLGTLMVSATMAVQFGLVFFITRHPATLLFTLIFAHFAFASLFEEMSINGKLSTSVLGLSGLLIATGLSKGQYRGITGLGYLFSGASFAIGYFGLITNWGRSGFMPLDLTLIATAAAMIYVSVMVRSRCLLFVGVVSMLAYFGYYTDEYFRKLIGWPIALMMFGIIMILAANYAVKLGRRFSRPA